MKYQCRLPEIRHAVFLAATIITTTLFANLTLADNPGLYPLDDIADTYVDESLASTNRGDQLFFFAGRIAEIGYRQRALLQFDHTALPDDAVVVDAVLNLYMHYLGEGGNVSIDASVVTEAWQEKGPEGVTWDTQPGTEDTPFQSIDNAASTGWKQVDITDLVQAWISGSTPNHGLMIAFSDEDGPFDSRGFYSRESANCAPYILVSYTTNEIPPEAPTLPLCRPRTDTTPPEITITVSPDRAVAGSPLSIRAEATDEGGAGVYRVQLLRRAELVDEESTDTAVSSLTASETVSLDPGIYRYSALAWDFEMNGESASFLLRVFQDGEPPRIRVSHHPTNPVPGDVVTFTAIAQDESGLTHITISTNGRLHDFPVEHPASTSEFSVRFDEDTLGYDPSGVRVVRYYAAATDREGFYTSTGTKYALFGNTGPDEDSDGLSDEIEVLLGLAPDSNDTDNDGLYDHWEVLGIDRDDDKSIDVDLPGMGATPHQKDVFVEMDWMEDASHSHLLNELAIQAVVNTYRDYAVNLHVDTGQLGGGNALSHDTNLENCEDGCDNCEKSRWMWVADTKAEDNFDRDRRGIFYYIPVVHNTNCYGPQTRRDGGGHIFLVTSEPGGSVGTIETAARHATFFLHELGHGMRLGHGGQEILEEGTKTLRTLGPNYDIIDAHVNWWPVTENARPNYVSNMNYRYQFDLKFRTDAGEDIFLYSYNLFESTLDETALDESAGIVLQTSLGPFVWRRGVDADDSGISDTDVEYELFHERLSGTFWIWPHEANDCASLNKNWWLADGSPIDWDFDAPSYPEFDPEPDAYAYDVNQHCKWDDAGECDCSNTSIGLLQTHNVIPLLRTKIYGSSASDINLGFTSDHSSLPHDTGIGSSPDEPNDIPERLSTEAEYADGVDNDRDGLIDEGFPDLDSDGIVDVIDNCSFTQNPDQLDIDRDRIGDACDTPPDAPAGLTFRLVKGVMTLQWTPSAGGNLIGYNVYRRTPESTDFRRLGPAFPTTFRDATYPDTECIDGTTYTISAVNFYMSESSLSEGVVLADADGDGICDQIQGRKSDPYHPEFNGGDQLFSYWFFILLLIVVVIAFVLFRGIQRRTA